MSPFHHRYLAVFAALASLPFAQPARAQATTLHVVSGSTGAGAATDQWLAILRKRLSPPDYDSVARIAKPRTADEQAWAALIQSKVPAWEADVAALAAPFNPVAPSSQVLIVLGNRGGGDAFTQDPATIGFDLAELSGNYGNATLPSNSQLMDRLFHHEFTHLMQKAWLPTHPWLADTPLRAAILDIWLEGQGNYYSLSDRWRSRNGLLADTAQHVLAALEPRFVARLTALACADSAKAATLMTGISSGPFDRKWGAVPAALWLDEEEDGSHQGLRNLIVASPDGVWDLADRHLAAPLALALREARTADSLCTAARR